MSIDFVILLPELQGCGLDTTCEKALARDSFVALAPICTLKLWVASSFAGETLRASQKSRARSVPASVYAKYLLFFMF